MTNIIQFPRGMHTPDKPREVIRESWVVMPTYDEALNLIEGNLGFRIYAITEDFKE